MTYIRINYYILYLFYLITITTQFFYPWPYFIERLFTLHQNWGAEIENGKANTCRIILLTPQHPKVFNTPKE